MPGMFWVICWQAQASTTGHLHQEMLPEAHHQWQIQQEAASLAVNGSLSRISACLKSHRLDFLLSLSRRDDLLLEPGDLNTPLSTTDSCH